MKTVLNRPEDFVDERVEGILAAHPDRLACVGGNLRRLIGPGVQERACWVRFLGPPDVLGILAVVRRSRVSFLETQRRRDRRE